MAINKNNSKAKETKVKKAKITITFAPLKFNDYTITQKRSGRFQVVDSKGVNVNGAQKEKLLLESKVLKGSFKKETAEQAQA